jgi:solute carrier family 26 (sodium-independent sulfate anion transporter), member 11
MAYSKLAQLPVENGLYTSFFGGLIYWVFGTSKDINIGPVAVTSIVTGTIIADIQHEGINETSVVLASSLAMLCGIVICSIGILRLGWLVDLISLPAVSAFITGSAITVSFGQIPIMLGMKGISSRDAAYKVFINICKHLDRIRIDAAVGVTALVMLYLIKWTCIQASKRMPKQERIFFFASTLRTAFVILLYTLISFLVNKTHRESPKFQILGFIPRGQYTNSWILRKTGDDVTDYLSGLHSPSAPNLNIKVVKSIIGKLPSAIVVLLIEHISIAKSFARINNYTLNPNSELISIGVTNMIGPVIGAYAATGSFSRSAINAKAGCRTPLAGVVTAVVVLLAMYTLTPVFFYVPNSVLASVIIHAIGDSKF